MSEITTIPHQLTRHTKFLHKVAIVAEQKVLLLQRSSQAQSRPGCWDLPGGNSEWPTGVTAPTSNLHQLDVAREIREEVGLEVAASHFVLGNLNYLESFYNPETEIYTIICGWQITDLAKVGLPSALNELKITISPEHKGFQWVSEAELANFDFGGAKGAFVCEIANQALQASI